MMAVMDKNKVLADKESRREKKGEEEKEGDRRRK